MANLPHVALGAGFVGAVNNKLATVNQKPIVAAPEVPAVSEKKQIKKAFAGVKKRGTEAKTLRKMSRD